MIFLMILERVLLPEPFVPLMLTDGKVIPLNHFQKDVFLFFLRFLALLIDRCIFRCFCRSFLCHNLFSSELFFV